jgi:hypothetical protein
VSYDAKNFHFLAYGLFPIAAKMRLRNSGAVFIPQRKVGNFGLLSVSEKIPQLLDIAVRDLFSAHNELSRVKVHCVLDIIIFKTKYW